MRSRQIFLSGAFSSSVPIEQVDRGSGSMQEKASDKLNYLGQGLVLPGPASLKTSHQFVGAIRRLDD